MRPSTILCIAAAMIPFAACSADTHDAYLEKIVRAYKLEPLAAHKRSESPVFKLGQMLFFDPLISGNREIACGTCHFPQAAGGDSLPIAVGVRARGIGTDRLSYHGGMAQRRNALAFWGVGDQSVTALFWDGRVQKLDNGRVHTPIGVFRLNEVGSLLGAAALLPVVEADEMTGFVGDRSPRWLETTGGYRNELAIDGESKDPARAWQIHQALVRRVLGVAAERLSRSQEAYRSLYKAAYPGRPVEAAQYADLSTAIGLFITEAFAVQPSSWDRYLAGEKSAISQAAKNGAIVFFGKGKCAVCHSGPLFSDFKFHALAVPQIGRGLEGGGIDPGRSGVTKNPEDKFAFRTPILRNVELTGPYTHSGYFSTLRETIAHHSNPIPALHTAQQREPLAAARQARLVPYLATELRDSEPLTDDELANVERFLFTLTSADMADLMQLVPDAVPSGLNHVVDDIRRRSATQARR